MQNFGAPSFDDKKLEVVAVFGSMQMAVSRVINLQHHRIAQVPAVHLHVHPGMCSARTCTDIYAWIRNAWWRTHALLVVCAPNWFCVLISFTWFELVLSGSNLI